MDDRRIKQVIVIRKDLKMRRGKEIAQGSHASMAFLTRRLQKYWEELDKLQASEEEFGFHDLSDVEMAWIKGSFAKVTLKVDSEDALKDVAEKAIESGLETQLIVDSGRTEFHGVPTPTCVAIGPDYADKIDPITGHLTPY